MTEGDIVGQVLTELVSAGANVRCAELTAKLRALGFEVRDGKKQGHKVVVHHGLENFTTDSFTCGHGRNPEIKPVYVRKMQRLVERYADDLRLLVGEKR